MFPNIFTDCRLALLKDTGNSCAMNSDDKYPSLADLKKRARRRLPHFVWEFLDSATGAEVQKTLNREGLDRIRFNTRVLRGAAEPDLSVSLLGKTYALPFGIAPVGMSGLIWPNAELLLAQAASKHNIPYCLSTVASRTPEDLAPHIGEQGWFQLYPPKDPEIRRDILERARKSGFHTLVLTADLPVASMRERQRRAGLTIPPRLSAAMFIQCMLRPAWSLGMAYHGKPRLKMVEKYVRQRNNAHSTSHAGYSIRTAPDMDYFRALRDEWHGPLVVKGVTTPEDAEMLVSEGADAIWVSNHAGRQFDGGAAAINMLPPISAAVKKAVPILFDSGVESGLDILRAIALGADFVMLGRGFHYALAALGADGPNHLTGILRDDLRSNMGQMGITELVSSKNHIWQGKA